MTREYLERVRTTEGNKYHDPSTVLKAAQTTLNQSKLGIIEHLAVLEQAYTASLDCGRLDEAEELLKKIHSLLPTTNSTRLAKLEGLKLEAYGKYDEAEKVYNVNLESDPTVLNLRKRLISVLLSKNKSNNHNLFETINAHLDTFVSDIETWSLLQATYLRNNMFTHALFCIEEIMLLSKNDPLVLTRYAEINYSIGKISVAIKYFSRAVELNESMTRAWWGLYQSCKTFAEEKKKDLDAELIDMLKNLAKEKLSFQYKNVVGVEKEIAVGYLTNN
ncbi:ER membrane complex subunit 2 [Clydaea vesicula]|uniref:ER membrane protein complex subunit 2 n=1 Tax=Clydaea vesicula TaxID=447962 RepID=A0AAD5XVY1_9FUNG|nr:ER membrane complex subunit 2 [Clydaea vesicula]KAJ3380724.1 ER membrane complex subunit 2 [Lobulomyces angularis]